MLFRSVPASWFPLFKKIVLFCFVNVANTRGWGSTLIRKVEGEIYKELLLFLSVVFLHLSPLLPATEATVSWGLGSTKRAHIQPASPSSHLTLYRGAISWKFVRILKFSTIYDCQMLANLTWKAQRRRNRLLFKLPQSPWRQPKDS